MVNVLNGYKEECYDEDMNGFHTNKNNSLNTTDDELRGDGINRSLEQIMESMTRLGGEVCRLRSEMDGVLEQNYQLLNTFRHLKDVIMEKGLFDMDDFQLACDVFEESSLKSLGSGISPRNHTH